MSDTPQQRLHRLLHTPHETYPLEVIEEMVPTWLAVLEDVMARPDIYSGPDDVGSRHWLACLFSTFLLAQFRVPLALMPLLKILRQPGETAFDIFGGLCA